MSDAGSRAAGRAAHRAAGRAASRAASRPERGQVLVLFGVAAIVLLIMAAIAIDGGRFYMEKRFLQNSADAAALAAANRLIAGGTNADAMAAANDVLTRNYLGDPNGITPDLPADPPIYSSGHAGEPVYLLEGILISPSDVRVSIHNHIPYTFGRIAGFQENVIYAQARVAWSGHMLPIAVRRYVNLPGPNSGAASPCPGNQNEFMDFFATANTSCLGTDTNSALRTAPGAGNAFDSGNPASDPVNHGPVITILGQGAQPSNGADFRGFIALDVRNFATDTSQLYYNGVNAGTNPNVLKATEANWITGGAYPGPLFPPATTPPDANDQVAIMGGNDTGIAIDEVAARFGVGDEVMVAVYPGTTMAIPDFTISPPGTVSVTSGVPLATDPLFKVSRNQSFATDVTLSLVADTAPGAPTPTTTFTPNPVVPSLGAGTTVDMDTFTATAADGIYPVWLRGEAGSPYLTVKLEPFSVKVGTVTKDFTITADTSELNAPNAGDSVTFNLTLKRVPNNTAFGGTVNLSVDAPLPSGVGAVTFGSTSVNPGAGAGNSTTLTINTGTMAPGSYRFVVRATGMNGDSPAHPVTHLLPLEVTVGTMASAGNQEYVDIVGFAVMRISFIDTNHVDAYAITPVIADMNDPQLRRGQVAKLVPWN